MPSNKIKKKQEAKEAFFSVWTIFENSVLNPNQLTNSDLVPRGFRAAISPERLIECSARKEFDNKIDLIKKALNQLWEQEGGLFLGTTGSKDKEEFDKHCDAVFKMLGKKYEKYHAKDKHKSPRPRQKPGAHIDDAIIDQSSELAGEHTQAEIADRIRDLFDGKSDGQIARATRWVASENSVAGMLSGERRGSLRQRTIAALRDALEPDKIAEFDILVEALRQKINGSTGIER